MPAVQNITQTQYLYSVHRNFPLLYFKILDFNYLIHLGENIKLLLALSHIKMLFLFEEDPNSPISANTTFESVVFWVIIFFVYPRGVVHATCAHYAPTWYKHSLFAQVNNSVCFNPTWIGRLSQCVTICESTSPGHVKEKKAGLPSNNSNNCPF